MKFALLLAAAALLFEFGFGLFWLAQGAFVPGVFYILGGVALVIVGILR